MSKPSIIIIPGAWQKPASFEGIVNLLDGSGYPTVHVPLPSVGGTETPLPGLDDDVEAVRRVLAPLVEEGKEVVLVGHSSGGVSMSAVVEGLDAASRTAAGRKGGVVRCIYLAAFVLPKGQSLLGMLGGQPLPWMVVEVSSSGPPRTSVVIQPSNFTDQSLASGRPCDRTPGHGCSDWLQRPVARGAEQVVQGNDTQYVEPSREHACASFVRRLPRHLVIDEFQHDGTCCFLLLLLPFFFFERERETRC